MVASKFVDVFWPCYVCSESIVEMGFLVIQASLHFHLGWLYVNVWLSHTHKELRPWMFFFVVFLIFFSFSLLWQYIMTIFTRSVLCWRCRSWKKLHGYPECTHSVTLHCHFLAVRMWDFSEVKLSWCVQGKKRTLKKIHASQVLTSDRYCWIGGIMTLNVIMTVRRETKSSEMKCEKSPLHWPETRSNLQGA